MGVPGFTAEAALAPSREQYVAEGMPPDRVATVQPTQLSALPAIRLRPGLIEWPIAEPTCIKVCLPSWGGHCRWICF